MSYVLLLILLLSFVFTPFEISMSLTSGDIRWLAEIAITNARDVYLFRAVVLLIAWHLSGFSLDSADSFHSP